MSQLFASGGQSVEFQLHISPTNEHPGLISFRMDLVSVNFICYLSTSEFCLYIANHITKDPLECPLGSKEIKPVNPKGNRP